MNRCVIVGGAEINEYERIKKLLREDDYFIYCDCGLEHFEALKHAEDNGVSLIGDRCISCAPNLIVGDFDSYAIKPEHNLPSGHSMHVAESISRDFPTSEIIVLPREKDDTDTVFAAKEALRRGFRDFVIIGAVGGRFDHSIGNIGLLLMLHEAGSKVSLIDDYSVMEIVGQGDTPCGDVKTSRKTYISDKYSYFSLLSVFGTARGVTITGAKFPTNDASFSPNYQYGVSNEVLPDETACVEIDTGMMLLVKVF